MAVIYDLADIWNDGATTFTAIKMDVTDTASASGSLLMDLRVGGVSAFAVGKDILEKKRGTNAQAFNLYNTYTDASNYERVAIKWSSNTAKIVSEKAGTGILRSIAVEYSYNRKMMLGPEGFYFWHDAGSVTHSGFVPGGLKLSTGQLWFSSGNVTTAADAGLTRTAAAQLKITDGSTGTGELIFIVPTTDPGIAGALWNNAGTLSISA